MLYDKLKEYGNSGIYPFHMPGHKRNRLNTPDGLPFDIDITEIPGFDDLHNADGILLEASRLATEVYKSSEAFMLVGGSTVGILAAIGAHAKRGDKILAVSNCHWSTPNAAKLFGLELVYINVEIDRDTGVPCSVSPAAVKEALSINPDIKMVVITSPTYEGVVSDIAAIADVTHNAGALLLVDGAHGAHLGFSEFFPKSAVGLGADVVVMSLHKTLPAMTQCSLLHICSERADACKVKEMLSILQTSSPSYVLMASADYCLQLLKSDGDKLFREYVQNLTYFYSRVKNLKRFSVLYHMKDASNTKFYDYDPGKIVIITKNTAVSSDELVKILREEFKIETECKFKGYVIAMTSIFDTKEGFTRLADALSEIEDSPLS